MAQHTRCIRVVPHSQTSRTLASVARPPDPLATCRCRPLDAPPPPAEGVLRIRLVGAQSLPAARTDGLSNSYVVCTLVPDTLPTNGGGAATESRSVTCPDSLNPSWNDDAQVGRGAAARLDHSSMGAHTLHRLLIAPPRPTTTCCVASPTSLLTRTLAPCMQFVVSGRHTCTLQIAVYDRSTQLPLGRTAFRVCDAGQRPRSCWLRLSLPEAGTREATRLLEASAKVNRRRQLKRLGEA